MSIDTSPTYDFSSVLIKPKYNNELNISSRSQVNLERTFHFKNIPWRGVPIISC